MPGSTAAGPGRTGIERTFDVFSLTEKCLYVREIDLWIDSMRMRERGYVSHGHADHAREHGTVIASPLTAQICRARFARKPRTTQISLLGKRRSRPPALFEEHAFNEPWQVGEHELTLFSAGHVLGSSQLLIEGEAGRFVYTGDFKLEPSYSCEAPEVKRCDVVLMECTFGRPQYVFPPRAQIAEEMIAFARETIAAGDVPVFFAYSLGKAQEAMAILAAAAMPMVVHDAIATIAEIYETAGVPLGTWRRHDAQTPLNGSAVVWPPSGKSLPRDARAGALRTAMLTGWAMDRSALYRYGAKRAFALSDHADYPSLLKYLELAEPRKVLLNHGWRDFVDRLRRVGIDAEYLDEHQQLALL
jgi:Cft2 family RNA processing exonuclease